VIVRPTSAKHAIVAEARGVRQIIGESIPIALNKGELGKIEIFKIQYDPSRKSRVADGPFRVTLTAIHRRPIHPCNSIGSTIHDAAETTQEEIEIMERLYGVSRS
jgi:hypothetical protein